MYHELLFHACYLLLNNCSLYKYLFSCLLYKSISQTVKLVANIKESTLYPILRKLEQNGYLHTYSQEFQGRNRKYYSITDSGKEQLIFLKKEWNEYYHTIDDIIEGRMIPDGK